MIDIVKAYKSAVESCGEDQVKLGTLEYMLSIMSDEVEKLSGMICEGKKHDINFKALERMAEKFDTIPE